MLPMLHQSFGSYQRFLKRPLDCFLAICAFIVLSPVLGITALLVRKKLGSPVLFSQERPGKDEKIFRLFKFRTMTDERDADGELLPDEVRLTKFGKVLRSTSLDELPELINIIRGDMSLVGPRPLLVKYLPYYTEEQRQRHTVRPGLTGYAQVHGRNTVNWDVKFEMDVKYTSHITFLGDAKILLKTVGKVFKQEGISSETSATMEDFRDYCVSIGRIPEGIRRE
jgi:undecaprenyl phosphate N,N'-diacetylbacillosamine 1-phosphate transferase